MCRNYFQIDRGQTTGLDLFHHVGLGGGLRSVHCFGGGAWEYEVAVLTGGTHKTTGGAAVWPVIVNKHLGLDDFSEVTTNYSQSLHANITILHWCLADFA